MCPEIEPTQMPVPAVQPTQVQPIADVYAVFCGGIDFATSQKFANQLTGASANGVKRIHLLFHTVGGFVTDGIFMYNLLRALPIEVILYNGGQVASAGVLAFLGTKHRKAAPNSSFLIHRSHNSPQFATATKLQNITKSLILDDTQSDAIFKEHLKIPRKTWKQLDHLDVHISSEDALKFGLVDEIANFSPPPGAKVLNALP